MADLINLKQARKAKAKADKEKAAQANRVLHGTPKALKTLSDAKKTQSEQTHSGHRLEKDGDDN